MKKLLQILTGLFLILILAYFAFLDISEKRKNDLLLSKKEERVSDKVLIKIKDKIESTIPTIHKFSKQPIEINITEPIPEKKVSVLKEVRVVIDENQTEIVTIPKSVKMVIEEKIIVEKNTTETIIPQVVIATKKIVETTIVPEVTIESVNIPTVVSVPVAVKNTIDVPIPIQAITAPIAVKTQEVIEEEVKRKIELKTKGVE